MRAPTITCAPTRAAPPPGRSNTMFGPASARCCARAISRVEPEDMKELKLIADDVNAPTLHRIQAYFSMGFVANAMQDAKLARDAYSLGDPHGD